MSGYTIDHSKSVAYSNFVFVLQDIITNKEYYPLTDELMEISEEIYSIITKPNHIISPEADRVIIKLLNDQEYSMIAKCFRYYYSNCIKTDNKCIQTWKVIKSYINKKYASVEEILQYLKYIDIIIDMIDTGKNTIDNDILFNLLCLSETVDDIMKDIFTDAYIYTVDRLEDNK